MISSVTTRGQITIDRQARRALSVQPGMLAVQVVAQDHLEVYFIPARHRRSLFGILPPQQPAEAVDWDAIEDRTSQSIAAEA